VRNRQRRCFVVAGLSSYAHLDERGASLTATLVRHNDQFEHPDIYQVDSVVLDLADPSGRAEIPLLAHNFPERLSNMRRPSQNKLLRAGGFVILEGQENTSELLRVVENETYRLSSGLSRKPASPLVSQKRRLNRIVLIFR